jgi:adenylate cyclase class 2
VKVLEREIKLRYGTAADARAEVTRIGAAPFRPRRLQRDVLMDTKDGALNGQRSMLRVRIEEGRGWLTFKGPVQPAVVKEREEIETEVTDASRLLHILTKAGFQVAFRYEKYREEFTLGNVLIAIDETAIGTFVEIEGSETEIGETASALRRCPADYVLDSYRTLYFRDCQQKGLPPTDMLQEPGGPDRP